MSDTPRFYIEVPADQVDATAQLLANAGVTFSPLANMVCLPKENLLDSIFTGGEGQYAIDKINETLSNEGHHEQLLLPFAEMDHHTRWSLLRLATLHISWERDYNPEIIDLDPQKVRDFLHHHPHTAAPANHQRPTLP